MSAQGSKAAYLSAHDCGGSATHMQRAGAFRDAARVQARIEVEGTEFWCHSLGVALRWAFCSYTHRVSSVWLLMGDTQQNGNYLSRDNFRQRGKSVEWSVGKLRGKAGLSHLLSKFLVLSSCNACTIVLTAQHSCHWLPLKVSERILKYIFVLNAFIQTVALCVLRWRVCWTCNTVTCLNLFTDCAAA